MNIVFLIYHPSALTNWITKLVPYMKNCRIYVFHIASLHQVIPIKIEGVTLYDVSGLSYKKAEELVKELEPDLFGFFSFRSMLELTYHRICEHNHINKVYIEHGLFSKDTMRFRTNKLKTDFPIMLNRQVKYLRTQLGAILSSPNPIKELILTYKVIVKSQFQLIPFDHYYLFGRRSYDVLSKVFNLEESTNVTYIGYPIFDTNKQISEIEKIESNGVLYVHQPLIFDGIASISYDEEKAFLVMISDKLSEQYGPMTLLLHPRANLKEYKQRYKNTNIDVIQSPNNYKCFANKSLIVGHYSTALLVGLYFEKPTLVLDFPSTKTDKLFAEIFSYVENINDIGKQKYAVDSNKKKYMLGEHNTYESIANILTKTI